MRWKYKNGVTYAMYDTKKEDKLSVGVLIIGPGRKKKTSLTGQYIVSSLSSLSKTIYRQYQWHQINKKKF